MNEQILLVIAIVVVVLVAAKLLGGILGGSNYVKAKGLFTEAEFAFFGVLQQAIGHDYAIFGKVRIADVINVRSGLGKNSWQKSFNAICSKHLDYVLCRPTDGSIVAAIELNDKSHQQKDRQERDHLVERICKEAYLPLIQIPTARTYSIQAVREVILQTCRETEAAKAKKNK